LSYWKPCGGGSVIVVEDKMGSFVGGILGIFGPWVVVDVDEVDDVDGEFDAHVCMMTLVLSFELRVWVWERGKSGLFIWSKF